MATLWKEGWLLIKVRSSFGNCGPAEAHWGLFTMENVRYRSFGRLVLASVRALRLCCLLFSLSLIGEAGARQQLIRLEWGFPCWALFCRCSSYHESWPAKWPMAWHLHQHHIDSFKSVKSLLRTISNSTFIDFFKCCEIFSSDITLRHFHHQRQTFKHLHSQLCIMYTVWYTLYIALLQKKTFWC